MCWRQDGEQGARYALLGGGVITVYQHDPRRVALAAETERTDRSRSSASRNRTTTGSRRAASSRRLVADSAVVR